ncbi:MAG: GNAT family N-acetyltransferase [Pyrinomonadaceae bacterium]
MLTIRQAQTDQEIAQIRELFREYEAWLGLDLCFQGFEDELAALPGKYAVAEGRLLLATGSGSAAGCIALRKINQNICEMKRLFVRDQFRGLGIGCRLIERLITEAVEARYTAIRLDTFPASMKKAVSLYEAHGFQVISPYYENPHHDIVFMELVL